MLGLTEVTNESLLAKAAEANILALYSHGLALRSDEYSAHPELQGAHLRDLKVTDRQDLLVPIDIEDASFAPQGIVFSAACLGGGVRGSQK